MTEVEQPVTPEDLVAADHTRDVAATTLDTANLRISMSVTIVDVEAPTKPDRTAPHTDKGVRNAVE